jgi:hypothetical protein
MHKSDRNEKACVVFGDVEGDIYIYTYLLGTTEMLAARYYITAYEALSY